MTKEAIVEFDNGRLFGSLFNNQEMLAIYIDSLKIAIDENAGPEAIAKVAEAINRVLMVMMEATSIIGQADDLQVGDPNVVKADDDPSWQQDIIKAPDMVGCEPAMEIYPLGPTGCVDTSRWGGDDVFDPVNDPRDVFLEDCMIHRSELDIQPPNR